MAASVFSIYCVFSDGIDYSPVSSDERMPNVRVAWGYPSKWHAVATENPNSVSDSIASEETEHLSTALSVWIWSNVFELSPDQFFLQYRSCGWYGIFSNLTWCRLLRVVANAASANWTSKEFDLNEDMKFKVCDEENVQ